MILIVSCILSCILSCIFILCLNFNKRKGKPFFIRFSLIVLSRRFLRVGENCIFAFGRNDRWGVPSALSRNAGGEFRPRSACEYSATLDKMTGGVFRPRLVGK